MADYNVYNDPNLKSIYGTDPLMQMLGQPAGYDPTMNAQPPAMPSPNMSNQSQTMMQTMLGTPSAPTTPQDQTPINIDGWKPHHTTTLGKIADIGLALLGFPITPFTKKVQRQNQQEAMEGFTQDPLNAIRRLSKIPGQEDKAWKLFEDYQQIHKDDEESNQRVEYYKSLMTDKSRGVLSSYLGAIGNSKDPSATYTKMLPTLRRFADQRHLDPSLLPDQYDPDIANTVMVGGITPEDQIRLNETANYHNQEIGIRQQGEQRQEAYQGARLGQMAQHEKAYEGHLAAQEQIATTRETRLAKGKNGVTYLRTKYGPGEVSPDGRLMKVSRGDGDAIYFNVGPNQWKLVKKVPKAQ